MLLRIMVFTLSVLNTSAFASVGALLDFWEYEAFLQAHPHERVLLEQLQHTVQAPAIPLKKHLKRPLRIAVIYPGEQLSDYWRRNIVAFEQRLHELSIDYELQRVFTRPGLDLRTQSQSLHEAMQWQPDYLIFTLDAMRHRQFISYVLNHSQTKVILQNITTPLKQWQQNQPFMYVGFDHSEGARLLADFYRARFPQGGKFAMLYFSPGYISAARGDSFIEALGENYQLESAFYTKANWQSAYNAAKDALSNSSSLDFIYACATDIALGAQQALKESKNARILLNGWGGGSAELAALQRGEIDVTVMRMNDEVAIAMAEAIKRDQKGLASPRVYSGEFALVTKEVPRSRLEQLKRRAFRYSQ